MIKLYGVSVSNYYNKVKFSLLEKGIAFSEETMAPSEDEAMLARSPMGKVPCIDVDGRPLSESQAIVEYLDAVQPQPRLIPADPYVAAKCRELIASWSSISNCRRGVCSGTLSSGCRSRRR